MQWYEIMPLDDLWIGEMLEVEAGGVKVLLINVEGAVQAYLDRCPHRASALSEGNLEGLTLTCATHLWEFNALTGRGINPENSKLIRFPVRIENGMICVEVPEAGAIPQHVDEGEDRRASGRTSIASCYIRWRVLARRLNDQVSWSRSAQEL